MPRFVRGSGDLRDKVHLQRRSTASDGISGTAVGGGFETVFTVAANLHPLVGGETVTANRLAGRQPYVLTIRQSSDTRQVNETWQVVDARNSNRVFAITAPPTDPDGGRAWLEILVTEGGKS